MELLAYVRVSTKKQLDAGTHKTQMDQIRKWAKFEGHTILEWYNDLGISGKEAINRPKFQQLKIDIKTHGEGVVAFSLSRFARSAYDLQVFLNQIVFNFKKSFFCVKDKIDTTNPYGRFFIQILAAINELEVERIRESTSAGRERKREEGGRLGGPNPKKISKDFVLRELKKGNSPHRIGKLCNPTVSDGTIRRRMKDWGFYDDYMNGVYKSPYEIPN